MGITIAFLIALACMIGGIFFWFKLYNSEDAADLAAHQARDSEKSVDFADVTQSLKQRDKI